MPLLKSSLDSLQVLICFTTSDIVLGLQTSSTPLKTSQSLNGSSCPYPKRLCSARDVPQQLPPSHKKRDENQLCLLATTLCTEREDELLRLYFSTVKSRGNAVFTKTQFDMTRGCSSLTGREEPLGSRHQAAVPSGLHSGSHQPRGLTRDFLGLWCSQAALSTPTEVSSVL